MQIRSLGRRALVGAATLGLVGVAGVTMPAGAGPDSPDVPDVVVAAGDGVHKPFFPDVTRLDDGRLVTVYYWSTEHSPAIDGGEDGRIMWTESADDGLTWSEPRVVIDTDLDDRDPQITQLRDGTILINWFRTDWTGYPDLPQTIVGTSVTRSTDGGLTWSEPVQVESPGASATTGKILELDGGDLLVPVYGGNAAGVVRSTDGGLTWPVENMSMMPQVDGIGLSEITIEQLADGTITSLIRSSVDRFERSSMSESTDNGYTWSDPVKVGFAGQAHNLLTLPNGALLATYGDTAAGQFGSFEATVGRLIRPRLGQSWADSEPLLLYRAGPGIDEGDPSTVALSGDDFFTVSYDSEKEIIVGTRSRREDYGVTSAPEKRTPDLSGHAHHGVVLGSPARVEGVVGSALELGEGDHIRVDRSDDLNVADGPFTLAGWFRTDDQSPQVLVWAYDQAMHPRVAVSSVWIRIEPTSNRIQSLLTNGQADVSVVRAPGAFADGEWHHIALTRDDNATILYVDGLPAASAVHIAGSVSRNAFTGLRIGQRLDGGDQLFGAVDEMVLLGRALTAQEVSELATGNVVLDESARLHLPVEQVRRGVRTGQG